MQMVQDALQTAEGMGGPDGAEYIGLMDDVIAEATQRRTTAAGFTFKERIATAFASRLKDHLTQYQMAELRRLNLGEKDPGVCHSHDFCDANMVMLEAYAEVMHEGNVDAVSTSDDATQQMWNAAWDTAKSKAFYPDLTPVAAGTFAGYVVTGTGGGCQALHADLPDKGYVWLTAHADPALPDDGEAVTLGVYGPEGHAAEEGEWKSLPFQDAIKLAALMRVAPSTDAALELVRA